MRIVFMGTPDFAVPSLQALIDAGHDVCAVYTQPDKPQGRKQILTAPPVKTLALEHDIPVFQPNTLKNEDEQARLRELASCCPRRYSISRRTAASTCMVRCCRAGAAPLPSSGRLSRETKWQALPPCRWRKVWTPAICC